MFRVTEYAALIVNDLKDYLWFHGVAELFSQRSSSMANPSRVDKHFSTRVFQSVLHLSGVY